MVIAYVISYEPVGHLQVELFELMNKSRPVDHFEYPSIMSVDGVIRPIPTIQPVSIDGSVNNQHLSGWKKYWKDNISASQVKADTSFEGTAYMNYSSHNPLLYDGVRPSS